MVTRCNRSYGLTMTTTCLDYNYFSNKFSTPFQNEKDDSWVVSVLREQKEQKKLLVITTLKTPIVGSISTAQVTLHFLVIVLRSQ